jgi:hypothetical protein
VSGKKGASQRWKNQTDNGSANSSANAKERKGKESKVKESKEENIIPPNIDMVMKYCQQRSNIIDPQTFIDYYESRGWMIGKNKMKNWQAAIRTWEKNNLNQKKTGSSDRTGPRPI